MSEFDRLVAEIALRQHSVITSTDVGAAGGNRRHVDARLLAGRWKSVYEDVWRLAGAPWTYEGKVLAAVKAAGPGAVASHLCAARLLDMGFATALPEISVPRGRNFRPKGVTVHTSSDLDRCGTEVRKLIPVTDAARTVLDLGRFIKVKALLKAIEDGRRLELLDWHDVVVCLATHARKGRHGITRLREAIAVGALNDGVTDTDSELVALSLFREYGFPEPTLQHRIFRDDGRIVAEMDFAYIDKKVNFEVDGTVHLDPVQRAKDDARDHELRTVYGWTVRRIPWEIPVHQPREFVRIVRETLASAAH
ncbi:MAG: hypothetical protein QOI61_1589 [Actinomycetota bacterium]|jgi:hypothetical protein